MARNALHSIVGWITKGIDLLTRSVIVITLGMMLFVICLQVFCRFVLGQALPWPEEASRFLMIWSLFLAAVYVHAEDGHLRLSFFAEKLSPKAGLIVKIILHLAILFFLIIMLKGGIFEVNALKVMKTGALRISRAFPYAAIPVSAALFIVVTCKLLVDDVRKLIKTWRSSY